MTTVNGSVLVMQRWTKRDEEVVRQETKMVTGAASPAEGR